VDAHHASCLDLNSICGGTRSVGYRQWPSGPPREGQQTLDNYFSRSLAVQEPKKNYLKNVMFIEWPPRRRCEKSENDYHLVVKRRRWDPLKGGAEGPGAPTINAKNVDDDPMRGRARESGVPTINAENVNDRPPGRRCRRSRSIHQKT
jgi:hypothetical protein